jgi:phosphatidylserine/phosphatidylglycerophosphate/cardiolipin synthase-like enzyme
MAHESTPPRARTRAPVLVAIGLLTVLLGAYAVQSGWLAGWAAMASARFAPAGSAAGSVPPLQVFFTTPTLIYPDKPWQRPEVPLVGSFLADIEAARTGIELASFDFDLGVLTDALVRAQRRGVAVRVVIDSENLVTPAVSAQAGLLEQAGVAVRFDRREPFMHHKFAVIDAGVTWLGSWNMTENDTYRNNNNMLRLASRRLAADYTHEFEQLFAGRFGTSKASSTPYPTVQLGAARVAVYFSPEDGVARHVLERLRAARRSIRFMAFSYTADPIAAAMIERAQAGVLVSGVAEAQNATGSQASFGPLRDAGIDVVLDGNCYILHHKVIIIDERTVITGSYNFTSSAERDNAENLVIIDDPDLARAYLDEFARVYAQAQAPDHCQAARRSFKQPLST